MNTNSLKSFAAEARIKLIDQITRKLDFVLTHDTAELRGKQTEIAQLNHKIKQIGREQVIETVAYTWFNRLMALRFMDANGYTLPKVVTPLPGMTNPEILQNALAGHIEADFHLDRNRLNDLLDGRTASTDAHTEAYKMLIVAACNHWYTAMPFMFERISDYTELLLPDDLLSDYSIVADIRNGMTDEDCQQEEILGWLYQFYISDKKDQVFKALSKNVKITAENIPAATQLFTPRWIVRYMVENTLGKLWLTFKPSSKLRDHMPYYIETPKGNAPSPLPEGIKGITDITFLDPCQGSGHVLVYAFDLFTKIYEEEGYNTNEIPALILQNNLFGIDIDPRAAQLAAFALTMKARNFYSRFLRKPVQPNVIALENVSPETIEQTINLPIIVEGKKIENYSDLSLNLLTQANNLGSLIQLKPEEVSAIQVQTGSVWQEQQKILKQQAEFLSTKYHCVVTNPPYMGGKGMNAELKIFVEKNFKKGKSDLMACFMERCLSYNPTNGKTGMINQHSWMFLSSYEDLRPFLIKNAQFESLLHLGARAFPEIGGEKVQNAAFVLGNYKPINKGLFIRLTDFGNAQLKDDKTLEAIQNPNCGWFYTANQNDFEKIPGSPIGYWLSQKSFDSFESTKISDFYIVRNGISTGDNVKYLRLWHEVSLLNTNWKPCNKGGSFRRWYGNNEFVVYWKDNGVQIKTSLDEKGRIKARLGGLEFSFNEGIEMSRISSSKSAFRYSTEGFIYESSTNDIYKKYTTQDFKNLLGYLNTKVVDGFLSLMNPTINIMPEDIRKLPLLSDIEEMGMVPNVDRNILISKKDWDSRETSWDFQQNELIKQQIESIKVAFESYKKEWTDKFYELHRNEEELNRQFIEIYGLQDELTPDVPLEEITILQEEGKIIDGQLQIQTAPVMLQLISYAVGCMFGRYSLDKPGLILANQGDTLQVYSEKVQAPTFTPDEDNIIPVLEGEWFPDDIVGRFREFLKVSFSADQLNENIGFIEDAIGKDIRKYFVKDFYNDHIKRYKKRPIYWMFSSPKGHFKALIYMHRYQPDTCSVLLNDYLQPFIAKLESAKQTQTMLSLREDLSPREKVAASKEIDTLQKMIDDCRTYERTLFTLATQKISMDLDDGVKVNYQKFKDVLVPIKGLEKEEE
ncbi:Type II restriction/modification system, DNA methylase subunit YeeA [Bacteroides luti]|uniref:site-specific DNA-methyltransferase (adenine-specific) n=1 Tax=Bacteroides luti TaxID=1297750 RepID=A0A1M5DSF3_9BACE|nr:BREX-1 system adenine-specific DNA-methyltransferase PglX [Bacteroides luti]SHF69865.1 Type II restriction/modification system, DNA methylase subunit YeeA [Bacteroides luti]